MKQLVLAAAALSLAGPALADENGIAIGEGRLHPYVGVEARYDSNVLYGFGLPNVGDLILHVRPGFDLNVPGTQFVMNFDANLDWNKYMGLQSSVTSGLTQLFAAASLGIGVNRQGAVGLELNDSFTRSDQTPSLSLGSAVISNWNNLQVGVPIRPGGGALTLTLNGQWSLETFEPFFNSTVPTCPVSVLPTCNPAGISDYGYNQVGGGAELRWKFLPRTAFVVDANYFEHIPTDKAVSIQAGGLKSLVGLAGLVTAHVAATLKAGYGDTFDSAGTPYRTWLANAEVEYVTTGTTGVKLGYSHDYNIDPGFAFALYGVHRAYAQGKLLVAGRLTAAVQGEWDLLQFASLPQFPVGNASAQLVRLSPTLDYELTRWLYLEAGYAYTYRTSSGTAGPIPAFNYSMNEVWGNFKVIY